MSAETNPSRTQPGSDGSLTRLDMLKNIRADFNDKKLTWAGREDRDISLDALDVTFWSSIQLHRCSEIARKQGSAQPTFTGVQVQERLNEIDVKIKAKKRHIAAAARSHAIQLSKAQESQRQLQDEERELKEFELAREELRDLEFISWSLL